MTSGWGRQEEIPLPPAPAAARLAARRDLLRARLPEPLRAVVAAGRAPRRNDDQFYPFRPSSDYVWLTGDQTPGGVLMLDPGSAAGRRPVPAAAVAARRRRVLPRLGRRRAVGRRPAARWRPARRRSGIACRPLAELPAALAAAGPGAGVARLRRRGRAAGRPRAEPDLDAELTAILSELRLVKDAVGDRPAARRRGRHHARVLRRGGAARPPGGRRGLTERHVEGAFGARARTDGNGTGYHPIAACGPHATILHWNRNDGPLRAGELLLLDAGRRGCDSLYTADVTRTFPVSGRYTGAAAAGV